MKCIVTVVDTISTTSMPVNEFVIYRSKHNYKIRQILIVCDVAMPSDVAIPKDVEVYLVGNDGKKIRELVKGLNKQYKGNIVYHMHHQKSALLFLFSTLFLNVRQHSLYTVHSTFSARDLKYRISSVICVLFSKYSNCVSNAAYMEYSSLVRKIKGKFFVAIPNGVDTERVDDVIRNNVLSGVAKEKILICVGRMIPIKNHAFLISLMKRLPDYKLVLIGKEDSKCKIRTLCEQESVADRVEIRGQISRDELFSELCKGSIYVSSSLGEGLPVSVLEAMCAGLIPIISDILPHREIGEFNSNISVLPLEDDIWIDTIKKLGNISEKERLDLSESMRNTVLHNFSLLKMHEKYCDIYEKLI